MSLELISTFTLRVRNIHSRKDYAADLLSASQIASRLRLSGSATRSTVAARRAVVPERGYLARSNVPDAIQQAG